MKDIMDLTENLSGIGGIGDLGVDINGFNRKESLKEKIGRNAKVLFEGKYNNVRYPSFERFGIGAKVFLGLIVILTGSALLLELAGLGNEPTILQARIIIYSAFATLINALHTILVFLLNNKLVTLFVSAILLLLLLRR